jgi:hypothetical protein
MCMTSHDPVFHDEAPDPYVVRAEQRLEMLRELAEIGMDLARGLKPGAEADKASGETPAKDPAAVYAPLSRAIRLTLVLEARTDEALRDLKAGVETVRQQARSGAAVRDFQAREEKVRELVLTVAEREAADSESLDALEAALEERLERDSAYFDCGVRPLRQSVERLCHDLGLSPDWSRWTGEGWDEEESLRSRFSPFNQPSQRPILDKNGAPLAQPLTNGLPPTPSSEAHACGAAGAQFGKSVPYPPLSPTAPNRRHPGRSGGAAESRDPEDWAQAPWIANPSHRRGQWAWPLDPASPGRAAALRAG